MQGPPVNVPFFRPDLEEAEISEVVATLRSGWLTTGPRVGRFEAAFGEAVGAQHALAVSSCTAAMHLALEALGLEAGQAVLVPTMTFAATAEVVRYQGALPVLVDCDPVTLLIDWDDAARKVAALASGTLPAARGERHRLVGVIPVHVGGEMVDYGKIEQFAAEHGLWVVEDAAHSFPAAWRADAESPWRWCGGGPFDATCFSFYANKTITTGEGGMVTTPNSDLATRMRQMALHGLSTDAWGRYTAKGSWDYRILAPGYKYNLTDIAAAIGLHQLSRAEALRQGRVAVASAYRDALRDLEELELPREPADRVHSWHLFPIRLCLDRLQISRDDFLASLRERGIGTSVHWRPLHLHPYYQEEFGWRPEDLPHATAVWERLVSLPIFPTMTEAERCAVVGGIRDLVAKHRRVPVRTTDVVV